jgi:hypothetical protein
MDVLLASRTKFNVLGFECQSTNAQTLHVFNVEQALNISMQVTNRINIYQYHKHQNCKTDIKAGFLLSNIVPL